MCNRLETIPACDGQMDRQTDRQTDILPRHSPRYTNASRGKNVVPANFVISVLESDVELVCKALFALHRKSSRKNSIDLLQ